ncbi:MAG: hypothetical protein ABJO67_11500 [Pseudoruegeria sp.]
MKYMILFIAGLSLSACADKNPQRFDGIAFKTDVDSKRKTRRDFTVSVSPAAASLDGAGQAARWESARHCIKYFGSSDVDWSVGPETDYGQIAISEGKAVFAGRCTG